MIATVPVRPWHGEPVTVRAHGEAVLRGMGVPPSSAPGLLAEAISPAGRAYYRKPGGRHGFFRRAWRNRRTV